MRDVPICWCSSVTLSMMLGPLLLIAHETITRRWLRRPAATLRRHRRARHPVIIAGFGRFGQIVARVLRVKGFRSPRSTAARRTSTSCAASATRSTTATPRGSICCAPRAPRRRRSFVLAIDDVDASVRTAHPRARAVSAPQGFARARNRQHAFALMDAGVTTVIRETYASSLEMAQSVLEALGETAAAARDAVRRFREHDEKTLGRAVRGQGGRGEVPRHHARVGAAAGEAVRGGPRPRRPGRTPWMRRARYAISGSASCRTRPRGAQPAACASGSATRAPRCGSDATSRSAVASASWSSARRAASFPAGPTVRAGA